MALRSAVLTEIMVSDSEYVRAHDDPFLDITAVHDNAIKNLNFGFLRHTPLSFRQRYRTRVGNPHTRFHKDFDWPDIAVSTAIQPCPQTLSSDKLSLSDTVGLSQVMIIQKTCNYDEGHIPWCRCCPAAVSHHIMIEK